MKINIFYYLVFSWMLSQSIAAQIGIGTSSPDPSANVDVVSYKQGILIPRMIETHRNTINLPATGLLIFNTDVNLIQVNKGTRLFPDWQTLQGVKGVSASYLDSGEIKPELGLYSVANGLNAISFGGTYNVASDTNSSATGGTYNKVNALNSVSLGGTYSLGIGINSSITGGANLYAAELNSSAFGGTTNTAFGINASAIGGSTVEAKNLNASAIGGTTNTSSGINSTVIGGITNFAYSLNSGVLFGIDNNAYGINSGVLGGASNIGRGINSAVSGGTVNEAAGPASVVSGGTTNLAKVINSGIIAGTTNTTIGINSIVFGGGANVATAAYSTVLAGGLNVTNGDCSAILGGYGNYSNSYGELVLGINGKKTVAVSISSFDGSDKILSIGNGIDIGAPLDALTVLKRGLAILPCITNIMINAASEKIITTKEYTNATYVKYGIIAPTSSSDIGVFGEIRVTATYTYTCIAENTWRRVFTSTW